MALTSELIVTDKMLDCIEYGLRPTTWIMSFEGSIRSIKTTTAIQMVHFLVQNSKEIYHLLGAVDYNSIKEVLLNSKLGLLTLYPDYYSLKRDKIGGWYIDVISDVVDTPRHKQILLCGFENKSRWKKINGHEFGVILLDEANTANMQFIDECIARQANVAEPKLIMTLNGDIPTHPIYTKYINYSKPLGAVPASILSDMAEYKKKKGFYYVHFTMKDNPTMTPEKIERAENMFPKDSYYYRIKILGERGTSGSLIFNEYMSKELIEDLSKVNYYEYVVGVDIGGNRAENSITLAGFKKDFSECAFVDNVSFKQAGYDQKKDLIVAHVLAWQSQGKFIRCICVDSAESNFIIDLKVAFKPFNIDVVPSYKATIKERCDMLIVLLSSKKLKFNNNAGGKALYDAYQVAKWEENKIGEVREDLNLPINDKMDSAEYSLTRHMKKLMFEVGKIMRGGDYQ